MSECYERLVRAFDTGVTFKMFAYDWFVQYLCGQIDLDGAPCEGLSITLMEI